ncbi:MAG: YbaB/EbfC family nucleoid-associated protein [Bdellovibrio sp. 28-41-41]|jgi:DNA-binding YbaB/EbfC family protein|nr:MAG: YbaB/EbfC family nucleoid-associated protein [Bdellovibrio sp. 28-41-41]
MKGMGGGGMAQLMKQANQMQLKMKKTQEEIGKQEFTGTSGGGAVTTVVTGDNKLVSVKFNPDVFKSGDAEMLEEMVVSATNDALKLAKETMAKEMEKITGGMGIPGMF